MVPDHLRNTQLVDSLRVKQMQKTPTVTIPESKVVKCIFHNLLMCGLGQNLIGFFLC